MSKEYIPHLMKLVMDERRSNVVPKGSPERHEKKGVAIYGLVVKKLDFGVANLCTMTLGFEEDFYGKPKLLPEHKICQGDVVTLDRFDTRYVEEADYGFKGIVKQVKRYEIQVMLYDEINYIPSRLTRLCSITKASCSITYERMLKVLAELSVVETRSTLSPLASVLLEKQKPLIPNQLTFTKMKYLDKRLNKHQRDAVQFALASPEIALIHGPPAKKKKQTGKTQTIVEIVRQLVNKNKSVLVTGPSNVSVDNILERIIKYIPSKIVRIGHPARVALHSIPYTLHALCGQKGKTHKTKVAKTLSSARIVFSTLNGAGHYNMTNKTFDVVIIDEVGQATEPDCWIALSKGEKAILAGDHLQLPPTVLSEKDSYNAIRHKGMSTMNTLSYTLFDRLLDTYGDEIKRMLQIQYRMNDTIMRYSSKALYDNKLLAHQSVRYHVLSDLDNVKITSKTNVPIILFDTRTIKDAYEKRGSNANETSLFNHFEACVAVKTIKELMENGVKHDQIGVITPYAAQVKHLRSNMPEAWDDIEVGSVDGFQGREKEVIILSMVRSNKKGQAGFLKEKRRLNVAITRAKRQLVIIGNTNTLGSANAFQEDRGFLAGWINWLKE